MVLLAQIEKLTGKYFSLATFLHTPTIEETAIILRKGQKELGAPQSSLVAIQSGGSKPPIFFVHGADGNILIYSDLARHLGSDQPFYGLHSQQLDTEQPFYTRVEEMASHFLKEIKTVQSQGPYFLGGYCLGGSIAYEMAQQLNANGQTVALLVLLETYKFSNIKTQSFMNNLLYYIQKVKFHLRNFLILKFREKLTFVREKVKAVHRRKHVWLGMITMKLSNRLAFGNKQSSHLYNLWKINDQAASKYEPGVYPGRITQFIPCKEYARYKAPGLGWDSLGAGGLETYKLPVFPAGMLVEPFVKLTAEKLKICIQRALESRTDK